MCACVCVHCTCLSLSVCLSLSRSLFLTVSIRLSAPCTRRITYRRFWMQTVYSIHCVYTLTLILVFSSSVFSFVFFYAFFFQFSVYYFMNLSVSVCVCVRSFFSFNFIVASSFSAATSDNGLWLECLLFFFFSFSISSPMCMVYNCIRIDATCVRVQARTCIVNVFTLKLVNKKNVCGFVALALWISLAATSKPTFTRIRNKYDSFCSVDEAVCVYIEARFVWWKTTHSVICSSSSFLLFTFLQRDSMPLQRLWFFLFHL